MVKVDESDPDAALMAAFVQTRDRRMFEQLFQKYRRPMLRHALRFVNDRARAEELTQEIFIRIYTTKAYEPDARFKTWVYRVATNLCLNEIRRPDAVGEAFDLTEDEGAKTIRVPAPMQTTPEDEAMGRQLAARLEAALDALPANQRAAFAMARQDGMTHEEIADILSTSVPAVKSLVHRALEALRKEVSVIDLSAASQQAKEAVQ